MIHSSQLGNAQVRSQSRVNFELWTCLCLVVYSGGPTPKGEYLQAEHIRGGAKPSVTISSLNYAWSILTSSPAGLTGLQKGSNKAGHG